MATQSGRVGAVEVAQLERSGRAGSVPVADTMSGRVGAVQCSYEMHSGRSGAVELRSPEFFRLVEVLGSALWVAEAQNVIPQPAPRLTYAGLDLSGNLVGDIAITSLLQGMSTLDITLAPSVGQDPQDLRPPGSGPLSGLLRQHIGGRDRAFQLHGSFLGDAWQSEEFFPRPIQVRDDGLPWGGGDLFEILSQPGSLPDIVRAAGDLVTAHQAARRISQYTGIQIECRYPNYLIGELRMGSGSPREWLDRLAKPMAALGRVEGGRVIYEQASLDRRPAWRFHDRYNIQMLECDELPRCANSFELVRFTPASGQIGEGRGSQVGQVNVSFEPSRLVIIDEVEVIQGDLVSWRYRSESGEYLTPTAIGNVYSGPVPAASAEGVYLPIIGATAYQPSWYVTVRGGPFAREAVYRFPAEDAEHQAIYGVVAAGDLADPVIGDEAGAALAVWAQLRESVRRQWMARLRTPYHHPWLRVGQVIEVTDARTGQSGVKWLVEQIKRTRAGGYWSTELTCYNSKGLQP